jgi:hypothetical protein
MKQLAVLALLIIGGLLAWLFASRLSADALGMAVGLVFGVLAGVPAALLVLAANRRRTPDYDDDGEEEEARRYGAPHAAHAMPFQPPVIVVASPQAAPQQWPGAQQWPGQQQWPGPQTVDSVGYPVRPALPGPQAPAGPRERTFKVVGEKEEWLDEW